MRHHRASAYTETARAAIGIFDSGLGGLAVVRRLRKISPTLDVLYVADTAHFPYGTRDPRRVQRLSHACQSYLAGNGVALVIAACNTASALGLRDDLGVPIIGAITPTAARAAAVTRSRHVGVLATRATAGSGVYQEVLGSEGVIAEVVGCPVLVAMADAGWTEGVEVEAAIRRHVGDLLRGHPLMDTLVLGCTHFSDLRRSVEAACRELTRAPLRIVDSADALARAAWRHIEAAGPAAARGHGSLAIHATDASAVESWLTFKSFSSLAGITVTEVESAAAWER